MLFRSLQQPLIGMPKTAVADETAEEEEEGAGSRDRVAKAEETTAATATGS